MSAPSTPIRLRMPLNPRSPDEPHRAATPLELFFDLVFVVAIAQAASSFHHAFAANHIGDGIITYLLVFFAIWWAWINFTWFASAYDSDDVAYRLIVFVQLAGALILAAGVTSAFENDSWGIPITGYVVMRLATVVQWLRVARADHAHKPAAVRYAVGITIVQIGWCLAYFLPESAFYPAFIIGLLFELGVPIWAESTAPTTWHAGHIAERYGLFTIIVLGESILAATLAIESTTITTNFDAELAGILTGGLLIVLSMWWVYFARNSEELLTSLRRAFIWGYGHYLVFGSAAAVGAGIAISVDYATDHAEIGRLATNLAVTIPVAIFLISVWLLHYRFRATSTSEQLVTPLFAIAVLLTSWLDLAVLLTGLLMAALVAYKIVIHTRQRADIDAAHAGE